jgi:SAM-dependent methyltransferase
MGTGPRGPSPLRIQEDRLSSNAAAIVWDRYARGRAPRRERNAAGAATWFNWTSHPDHGPDETVLGDVRGRTVLELGSGTGCNLAHLAACGANCTGLDVSPVQTGKAVTRWGGRPQLEFRTGEAVEFLASRVGAFDVVYSVFGAAWFTDPEVLFPLVRKRLAPGGVLAFSHTAPVDCAPLAPAARISRNDLDGEQWTGLLGRHGFVNAEADVIDAPGGVGQRTLLVRAYAS